ncbi:MAG: hypothetical protein JNL72_05850 [Flavipsychrobacter sp.]|nr:hypothetical protein [Flavipsychrobacter sp.]
MRKILWLLLAPVLATSCGEKKTSDRMAEVCGIELPRNVVVEKDQHIDAGKDYGIQYQVRLIPAEMKECTQAIRGQQRYRMNGPAENDTWVKTDKGYSFYLAKDGIYYIVEVDTVKGVIVYDEQG